MSMKKILSVLFILLTFCTFNIKGTIFAEQNTFVVIYSVANVYSMTNINDESNTIVATLNYADEVNVDGSKILGADNLNYYKINLSINNQDLSGYILCSMVKPKDSTYLKKQLDANSKLLEDSEVYEYKENQYIPTGEILKSGTEVFIIDGVDNHAGYTKVQYINISQDIITAYVKTSSLNVSGISRTTIGVIIIVVTTVSLAILIFGVGKKKKSKN